MNVEVLALFPRGSTSTWQADATCMRPYLCVSMKRHGAIRGFRRLQTHTYVSCRRALLERGSAPQKYFHFVTRYFTTCRSTSSTSSSSYKYFLFVTSYLPTPAGSFWFFYTRPATTCPRVLIAAASLGSAARTPPPLALPIVAPCQPLPALLLPTCRSPRQRPG